MNNVKPIKIAILAMGGEGGGVLADWVVDLGENNGYVAQTTSVPGVAQRTGATIYYVELFPEAIAEAAGRRPVLALMPMPGDVDIVLCSELMEAGRAVQRGLVTADRTTLISSTHRVFSIAEKTAMGDGRVDSENLLKHATKASKHFVRFDMEQAAAASGSVISAVLFGALAGTGVLPFTREQFEATVERGGVGVKPSLRAFGAAYDRAIREADGASSSDAAPAADDFAMPDHVEGKRLWQRVNDTFPASAKPVIYAGVRRLADYQDPAYADAYLDRLVALRSEQGFNDDLLLTEVARHLALWMSYEDTIRVADLKTRGSRFERVRNEVRADKSQLLAINEFMHPRLEEICETLPAGLGRWLMQPNWAHRLVRSVTQKGRVMRTSSLGGYLALYTVAGMRRWRRSTLRYVLEHQRIEAWLAKVVDTARTHPALAIEVARCQRLVKGYSDTHTRGLSNFLTLMDVVARTGTKLAPATLRELRDAALADEHGKQLRVALLRHSLGAVGAAPATAPARSAAQPQPAPAH